MVFETGWRSRLQAASFRGVPFEVDNEEAEFGRRVQVHEYPNRDKPFTEDLGRATRRITINAYLIGDDYPEKRDRLIAAAEAEGAATLVHPYYGEMKGNVDGTIRVLHSNQEGRMCRVTFQFVESGELSFPASGVATGDKLSSSADSLVDRLSDSLGGFSLDGLSDFLQSGVLQDAADMVNVVTDAFHMVDSGIDAAMRLLNGDLSVLLMPPSTASNFVHALQNAWRSGTRLSGDASDLVSLIKTIGGVTVDPGLAPRGVWKTDSGTTAKRTEQRNLIASALRVVAISEAARSVSLMPSPARSPSRQESSVSDIVNISHPALDSASASSSIGPMANSSASTSTSTTTSTTTSTSASKTGSTASTQSQVKTASWDDLTEIRETLNTAIDTEQLRTTDDGVFLALTELRADVNRDISSRLAQVEKTTTITPPEVLPAVVLAATWYDDARRENDILYRNSITHPGFVPVMPLRVPVS